MADDIGGVWRTIGGRRVFIKTGQSLSQAMKASGKFKRLKKKEEDSDPRSAVSYFLKKGEFEKAEEYIKDYGLEDEREEFAEGLNYKAQKDYKEYLSKAKDTKELEHIRNEKRLAYDPDEEEAKLNKRENAKIREYREQGMTLEEAVNKADKEFEKERDEINNKRGRQYDEAKKIQDTKEAQTIQSVSKLVQLEMNDTGDESVDQFVDRLVGKNAKSVEAKRTELNKRLEHASEEYSKYAKSLNYTEKFRDDFEYWSREKRLYAELVHNYDKLHKKKTKATNAPLF